MKSLFSIRSLFFSWIVVFVQTSCTEDFFVLPEESDLEQIEEDTQETTTSELSAFALTALNQVNRLRQQGVPCSDQAQGRATPLRWNDQLAAAAYRHAKDMADKDYFAHQGSDGSKVGDRVTASGYTWKGVAENIAKGQRSIEEVMQGWKNSPGHCRNMMHPKYTEMGMARVGNIWVQVFATER
jgi:uncharacterized protein YkwD